MQKLLSEMEQLLQDFREAQVQLIDELKAAGETDYADRMVRRLERKEIHYKEVMNSYKTNN